MAKSLDKLIDFLLEEIALRGDDGLSFRGVARCAREFYNRPDDSPNPISPVTQATIRIDRSFLAKLWQWLIQSDGINIASNDQANLTGYDDVEARYPGLTTTIVNDQNTNAQQKSGQQPDDQAPVAGPEDSESDSGDDGPLFRATLEGIYYAICGHGPDPTRVFASEYALLCAIAATRYDGILQGYLGRITGQDKRSVPKRTDVLQEKGYIVKRAVWMGGHKTSRLFLRRFAEQPSGSREAGQTVYRLRDLALQVFSALKDQTYTTQEELATSLSIVEPARKRVLAQLIRHLVQRKFLKKLRVAKGPGLDGKDLKICIQVIREPEEDDLQSSESGGLDLDASVDDAVSAMRIELAEAAEDAQVDDIDEILSQQNGAESSLRPQWNPDRIFSNSLYDSALNADDEGITNMSARQFITGHLVRRPLESLLVRLSHNSLKTQPKHLRHLALIRSWEVKDAIGRFVHRAYPVFERMALAGETQWSAVAGGKEIAKELTSSEGSPEALALKVDQFGFSQRSKPKALLRSGQVDLAQVAEATYAANLHIRSQEPILHEGPTGVSELLFKTAEEPDGISLPPATPIPPSSSSKTPLSKRKKSTKTQVSIAKTPVSHGRPRKFTRGTEKFWREVFLNQLIEDDPTYPINGAAGMTNDPKNLLLYYQRPSELDEMVVKALEHNLPVPTSFGRANQAWVDHMKDFFTRQTPGLFFTPSGMQNTSRKYRSCVVVIRSNRLAEIKPKSEKATPMVFFISSSVAHSHRLLTGFSASERKPNNRKRTAQKPPTNRRKGSPQLLPSSPAMNIPDSILDEPREYTGTLDQTSLSAGQHNRSKKRKRSLPSNPNGIAEVRLSPYRVPSKRTRRDTASALSAEIQPSPTGNPSAPEVRQAKEVDMLEVANSPKAPMYDLVDVLEPQGLSQASSITPRPGEDHQCSAQPDDFPLTPHSSQRRVSQSVASTANTEDGVNITTVGTVTVDTPEQRFPHVVSDKSHSLGRASLLIEGSIEIPENKPVEASIVNENNEMPSAGPEPTSTFPTTTAHLITSKRANDEHSMIDTPYTPGRDSTAEPSGIRTRVLVGRDATDYYRAFIMELIHLCGGLIPNTPPILKRAMKTKCIEAHVDPEPLVKSIKTGISMLIKADKLKKMTFAFQRKGFNYTKEIIALPHFKPSDPQFQALSAKISSVPYEEDYEPPELEREANRKPVGTNRRDPAYEPVVKPKRQAQQKKTRPSERRRRGSTESIIGDRLSLTPPPPLLSANTGFLTLKVGQRIAEVRTSSDFTTRYFGLPVPALRFEANTVTAVAQTTNSAPVGEQRSGVRISRNATFGSNTSKIQWRIPKTVPLPTSLNAILSRVRKDEKEVAEIIDNDDLLSNVERSIELVATWEEIYSLDVQDQKPGKWNFINHFTPEKDIVEFALAGELHFRLLRFTDGEEKEEDLPPAISWYVFADATAVAQIKVKKAKIAAQKRKRVTEDIDGEEGDHEFSDSPLSGAEGPPLKRARRAAKSKPKKRKSIVEGDDPKGIGRRKVRLQPRGIGMRHLPQEQATRLGIAFAVVKVLAGGLDRYLDFALLARLIPEESETLLRERWKVLSTRYNNDFDALVEDFQIKYLDALADERVPTVNFDNLENTNWHGILDWAYKNINTKSKDVFREIPPSKDELLTLNTVEVTEAMPVRQLWNQSLAFTLGMKEEAWCSAIFGTVPEFSSESKEDHLLPRFAAEQDEKDESVSRAKSWILATLLTPQQTFNARHVHSKLGKLTTNNGQNEEILDSAMKKLQNDRVIIRDDNEAATLPDGSSLSGAKGWKVSSKFFDKFDANRQITPRMLRDAATYKIEVLDPAFAAGEKVPISKESDLEDGTMMAILNLLDMGMLCIRPGSDVPASRYGLDWENEGYKTRSMDKNVLAFSTCLEATPAYFSGDPVDVMRGVTLIPRGQIDQDDEMGLIPVWFDINHAFQPVVWEMVLGAVVGIVSVRPGVSSLEIVRTLGWVVALRDMDLVLGYLLDCGLVKRVYDGWQTTEWWWFALGVGAARGVVWNA